MTRTGSGNTPNKKHTHVVQKWYITNILGIICMPGDSRYLERKNIHLAGSYIFHWKLLHFRRVMASNNVTFKSPGREAKPCNNTLTLLYGSCLLESIRLRLFGPGSWYLPGPNPECCRYTEPPELPR